MESVLNKPLVGNLVYSLLGKASGGWTGKPSDWSDIRKGCPANAIALYAGVKSDYTSYDNLGFTATCTGGYKVYIDGNVYGSYASGSTCNITWSTSGITTGDDITTPSALKAHKIWIEPATNGENITAFHCDRVAASGTEQQGLLWVHFNLTNEIKIEDCFYSASTFENRILTACTAKNNKISLSFGMSSCFYNCVSLEYVPVFIASNSYRNFYGAFRYCYKLKELTIKNLKASAVNNFFTDARSLEKLNLPNADFSRSPGAADFLTNASKLEDIELDARTGTLFTRLGCYGSSSYFMGGFKGLRVSNQAPFSNATAPQINVSYTGMNRAALVQLFNDLPDNVGYIIKGTLTDNSGVLSGSWSNYNLAYMNIPFDTLKYETWSIKIFITTSSSFGDMRIWSAMYSDYIIPVLGLQQSGKLVVWLSTNGSSYQKNVVSDLTLDINKSYYIKMTYDGSIYQVSVSEDDITYENFITIDDLQGRLYSNNTSILTFGASGFYNPGNPFNGSIDMSKTIIEHDGIIMFKGDKVSEKIISSVSCTGNQVYPEGNIIIDNEGNASGFSNNAYLSMIKTFSTSSYSNWSIKTKIKTGNVWRDSRLFSNKISDYITPVLGLQSGKLVLWLSSNGNSWNLSSGVASAAGLSLNTTYFVKFYYDGTKYCVDVSEDDITYENFITINESAKAYSNNNSIFSIGRTGWTPNEWFNGTINLSDTIIEHDGIIFFDGSMFLSSSDKNIAINKGWTLLI